jgi:Flp pilus assembly protein TadG
LNDFPESIHMVKKTRSQRGQRGNILVFLTLALPFFVGIVGLGIDTTMCYIVQAELSAAVDGAALGTGRLLTTNANPTDIANEYLNANFRVGQYGFWGAYNLTPTVTVVTGITKTVTVTATANVPLLFMRLLHQNAATVGATATATRRDARIEFVIDRSGSMTNTGSDGKQVIVDVLASAVGFTEQFTSCPTSSCTSPLNYDELGLVAFSGSAAVGYPTTPWPEVQTTNGAGGPDIYFYNGATTDMVHQLNNIAAGGGTAMGDGLALAYIELQKTHVRDMAANGGIDTRMNAIVLFTDGVPSSVVTYLNRKTNSVISSGSGCTYKTDAATPTNPIYGYVVVSGSPPYSSQSTYSFFQLASLDASATHTSAWYMAHPGASSGSSNGDYFSPPAYPVPAGCSSSGWTSQSNLSAIPTSDKYGWALSANVTGGVNGYMFSSITGDASATSIYNGTGFSTSSPTSAYQWGLAGWDEVDNVAQAIRSDSNYAARGETSPMPITIYTIGYTGNGGTDGGLLTKIANIAGCSVNGYSCAINTQKQGLYAQASNASEIAQAFNTILTAILRLSQ